MTRSTLGPPELPRDLMDEPGGARTPVWIGALVAAVVIGVAIVVARSRRRPAAVPVAKPAPEFAPDRRAVERLGRLRRDAASGLASDAAIDRFHVELSVILREFIEERFAVGAPRMSTEQLAVDGVRSGLDRDWLGRALGVLGACDRVKFAQGPSSAPARDALVSDAESIVRAASGAGRG